MLSNNSNSGRQRNHLHSTWGEKECWWYHQACCNAAYSNQWVLTVDMIALCFSCCLSGVFFVLHSTVCFNFNLITYRKREEPLFTIPLQNRFWLNHTSIPIDMLLLSMNWWCYFGHCIFVVFRCGAFSLHSSVFSVQQAGLFHVFIQMCCVFCKFQNWIKLKRSNELHFDQYIAFVKISRELSNYYQRHQWIHSSYREDSFIQQMVKKTRLRCSANSLAVAIFSFPLDLKSIAGANGSITNKSRSKITLAYRRFPRWTNVNDKMYS